MRYNYGFDVKRVTPAYIRAGEPVVSKLILQSAKGPLEVFAMAKIEKDAGIIVYEYAQFYKDETSEVSGSVTERDRPLHVSEWDGTLSYDSLVKNAVEDEYYDPETGDFYFEAGWQNTTMVFWQHFTLAELAQSRSAQISVEVSMPEPGGEGTLFYEVIDPIVGEPRDGVGQGLTGSGDCPSNTDYVYCSVVKYVLDPDTGEYVFPSDVPGALGTPSYICEASGGAYSFGEEPSEMAPATFSFPLCPKDGPDQFKFVFWCWGESTESFSCECEVWGWACLTGDTLITIADGTQKALKDVRDGDTVMGRFSPVRVLSVRHGAFSRVLKRYAFEEGTVVEETHDHRFYNAERGLFVRLREWKIGDHAVRSDGSLSALVSVSEEKGEFEMFGLWTEDGTYFANGLLSGDADANVFELEGGTVEKAVEFAASLNEEQIRRAAQ